METRKVRLILRVLALSRMADLIGWGGLSKNSYRIVYYVYLRHLHGDKHVATGEICRYLQEVGQPDKTKVVERRLIYLLQYGLLVRPEGHPTGKYCLPDWLKMHIDEVLED